MLAVTIKGAPSHPVFSGAEFIEKEASFSVVCDDSYEIHMSGELELLAKQELGYASIGQYRLRPIFFEQQRYEIVIEPAESHLVDFWHENYNIRRNVTPVGRKSAILSGIINFGNEIGMSDLIIRVDGRNYLKLTDRKSTRLNSSHWS